LIKEIESKELVNDTDVPAISDELLTTALVHERHAACLEPSNSRRLSSPGSYGRFGRVCTELETGELTFSLSQPAL